jgi:hypothetical protein
MCGLSWTWEPQPPGTLRACPGVHLPFLRTSGGISSQTTSNSDRRVSAPRNGEWRESHPRLPLISYHFPILLTLSASVFSGSLPGFHTNSFQHCYRLPHFRQTLVLSSTRKSMILFLSRFPHHSFLCISYICVCVCVWCVCVCVCYLPRSVTFNALLS